MDFIYISFFVLKSIICKHYSNTRNVYIFYSQYKYEVCILPFPDVSIATYAYAYDSIYFYFILLMPISLNA